VEHEKKQHQLNVNCLSTTWKGKAEIYGKVNCLTVKLPTQACSEETEIDVHQMGRLCVGGCSDCDILLRDAV